jgi:homopolymeric O-antigen transport system ATP-binding protein
MAPIIEIRHLSKQYQLGEGLHKFDTLMEYIGRTLRFSQNRGKQGPSDGDDATLRRIWSLRDVNVDVERGDVIGIIGTNGAGKSTLLKILSRITDPSEGYVKLRGRSASLLEVGTGFHPDLTGRENIFLNGGILGMSKAEIRSKFDEIVAFSGVERFIDTPVKRYSSGMYVRLAFAVAAHLEPEILIVDEVLAVGDLAFQKKCLGKMREVSKEGRTVLFVSHNMAAVENLCRGGILLDQGRLVFSGTATDAVSRYVHTLLEETPDSASNIIDLRKARRPGPNFRPLLQTMELLTENRTPVKGFLPYGKSLEVRVTFQIEKPDASLDVLLSFNTLLGDPVFVAHSAFEPECNGEDSIGEQVWLCEIPSLTLVPGEYIIRLAVGIGESRLDMIECASRLTIYPADYYGTGKVPKYGVAVLPHRWRPLEKEAFADQIVTQPDMDRME